MATVLTVKLGDTRDWVITLSDADNDLFDLTGCTVGFSIQKNERNSTVLFSRNTGGTGSDFISVSSPASSGVITITPTVSDWSAVSDYGTYVAEFKITDSNSRVNYWNDLEVNFQEPLTR